METSTRMTSLSKETTTSDQTQRLTTNNDAQKRKEHQNRPCDGLNGPNQAEASFCFSSSPFASRNLHRHHNAARITTKTAAMAAITMPTIRPPDQKLLLFFTAAVGTEAGGAGGLKSGPEGGWTNGGSPGPGIGVRAGRRGGGD